MSQQAIEPDPTRTPNPATTTRPARSSRRVAHKTPLGWLPWAALALLIALLALAIWAASEANESDDRTAQAPPAGSSAPSAVNPGAGAAALGAGALIGGGGAAPQSLSQQTGGADGGQPAAADVAGTVLFPEGSAAIDANGQRVIAAAAAGIRRVGASSVEVDGYTDVIAGQPVNKPLSAQRASNVVKALQKALGSGVTVATKALGEADPVGPNDTPAGRTQNRRAVIHAH